jgi:hypothetical protein
VTRPLAVALASLVLATGPAAVASGTNPPRYLWTQPAPWGDPSPRAVGNGLEFWHPHPSWAVAVDQVGEKFVRFSHVQWHGWRTGSAVATAVLEDCFVVDLRCGEPVRVRLVLSRPRAIGCGAERRGGTLVYTRYELTGYRALAGVERSTRAC